MQDSTNDRDKDQRVATTTTPEATPTPAQDASTIQDIPPAADPADTDAVRGGADVRPQVRSL